MTILFRGKDPGPRRLTLIPYVCGGVDISGCKIRYVVEDIEKIVPANNDEVYIEFAWEEVEALSVGEHFARIYIIREDGMEDCITDRAILYVTDDSHVHSSDSWRTSMILKVDRDFPGRVYAAMRDKFDGVTPENATIRKIVEIIKER